MRSGRLPPCCGARLWPTPSDTMAPTPRSRWCGEGMDTNNPTFTAEDLLAHAGWLHRLAARLVSSAEADDVVQDTWVAAMRSPPSRDRPARPWLAPVMRNLARNRARTARPWRGRAEPVRAAGDPPPPTADAPG